MLLIVSCLVLLKPEVAVNHSEIQLIRAAFTNGQKNIYSIQTFQANIL